MLRQKARGFAKGLCSRQSHDERQRRYARSDVDLVLSTVELLEMMEEDGVDLSALSGAPSPEAGSSIERVMDGGVAALGEASEGYGSGGFLEHIFRYSAQELFGVSVGEEPLVFKSKRNADFQYTELVVDGDVKLRFAKAYGFRNIQSVVKQLRRKKCKYDYIEIMACPSGCLNGGGQGLTWGGGGAKASRKRLAETKREFHAASRPQQLGADLEDGAVCQLVYGKWLVGEEGGVGGEAARRRAAHPVPRGAPNGPRGPRANQVVGAEAFAAAGGRGNLHLCF